MCFYVIRTNRTADTQPHTFFNSTLDEGEWSYDSTGHFNPSEIMLVSTNP